MSLRAIIVIGSCALVAQLGLLYVGVKIVRYAWGCP
jgi:hypothetical protein